MLIVTCFCWKNGVQLNFSVLFQSQFLEVAIFSSFGCSFRYFQIYKLHISAIFWFLKKNLGVLYGLPIIDEHLALIPFFLFSFFQYSYIVIFSQLITPYLHHCDQVNISYFWAKYWTFPSLYNFLFFLVLIVVSFFFCIIFRMAIFPSWLSMPYTHCSSLQMLYYAR